MDLARPFHALAPSRDMDVLRELTRSDAPRTGRRIAADAGVAHSTALRILDRLESEGIVVSETAGAARVFRLNEQHVLVPVLLEIAQTRARLTDRFRSEIATWAEPPELAVIFGSFARGDAGIDSDVDVLVVRPRRIKDAAAWDERIDQLATRGRLWSGNVVNVIDFDLATLKREPELLSDVRTHLIELTDGARDRLVALR